MLKNLGCSSINIPSESMLSTIANYLSRGTRHRVESTEVHDQDHHVAPDDQVSAELDLGRSESTAAASDGQVVPTSQVLDRRTDRNVPTEHLAPQPELLRHIDLSGTTALLSPINSPWAVSPDPRAILTSSTNIHARLQGLALSSLSISYSVDVIYCIFCLAEDGTQDDENVILRCQQCRGSSHLGCMRNWLKQRKPAFNTSCCVW